MTEPSYYRCSLFDQDTKDLKYFKFIQEELLIKKPNVQTATFNKLNVEYECFFEKYEKADWTKPAGIICIKDNVELLEYTLKNLEENSVYDHINFIIVDDRSETDIKAVCKKFPVNYLRVNNEKGFNFSVINNIAAKLAWDNGSTEIILWNSDLFAPDSAQVPELLALHKKHKSIISGTKLLYPVNSWNGNNEATHNIKSIFPNKTDSYRGTIQFGGSMYAYNTLLSTYFPNHFCRFKEKDYYLASTNKLEIFVTGAFQVIDLKWFIDAGGLNCSMATSFQDVDLCMRAVKQNKSVYYFGEKNYLYHDESLSISNSKRTLQAGSDHILFARIWNHDEYVKSILKFEE